MRVCNLSNKPYVLPYGGKDILIPPQEDVPGYWSLVTELIEIPALDYRSGRKTGETKVARTTVAKRHNMPVIGSIKGNVVDVEAPALAVLRGAKGLNAMKRAGIKPDQIVVQDQVVGALDREIEEKQRVLRETQAKAQQELAAVRAQIEAERQQALEDIAEAQAQREALKAEREALKAQIRAEKGK